MKTDNDYLAEYVRETRPEIEQSLYFVFWKMARVIKDGIIEICETLKPPVTPEESKEEDQMGTNYYAVRNRPTTQEPIHIGKSSFGWKFCFQTHNDTF